jgi:hypothetical protein
MPRFRRRLVRYIETDRVFRETTRQTPLFGTPDPTMYEKLPQTKTQTKYDF